MPLGAELRHNPSKRFGSGQEKRDYLGDFLASPFSESNGIEPYPLFGSLLLLPLQFRWGANINDVRAEEHVPGLRVAHKHTAQA